MDKIVLTNNTIREVFRISEKFDSIDKFCDFITLQPGNGHAIKKLLNRSGIEYEPHNMKRQNVALIRDGFVMEGESAAGAEPVANETGAANADSTANGTFAVNGDSAADGYATASGDSIAYSGATASAEPVAGGSDAVAGEPDGQETVRGAAGEPDGQGMARGAAGGPDGQETVRGAAGELDGQGMVQKTADENGGTHAVAPPPVPRSEYDMIISEFEDQGYQELIALDPDDYDTMTGAVLKENGIITQQDELEIEVAKEGLVPDLSKLLLVRSGEPKVLALGRLLDQGGGVYSVIFDKKEYIRYGCFDRENENSFRLVLFAGGQLYSLEWQMDYVPFEVERERPLCIDFGTSNTTAGSYGIIAKEKDEPEIVRFIDVTAEPNNPNAILLPTVVYVKDCSDPANIRYLFGYEARKQIEKEHYESNASVYYEIKRWIVACEEEESIRDARNISATVKRKDIIKAYLDYVISWSEQYFGRRFQKLHFSAPVKLKKKFIGILDELYREDIVASAGGEEVRREILPLEDSIDEGIAIVYNRIINMIYGSEWEQKKNEEGRPAETSIMILDCGGGTTDLASCEFTYDKKPAGGELSIKTCFENGNSNFGGNNITYRIMQLLKIKMAAAYRPGLIDDGGEVIGLIDKSEEEVLYAIEKAIEDEWDGVPKDEEIRNGGSRREYNSDGLNEVYTKFVENYRRAEQVIPTIYGDGEKRLMAKAKKRIKRNFYYLWGKAEQIKIEFYKGDRVMMDFHADGKDQDVVVGSQDNYYLYFMNGDGKLEKVMNPMKDIRITIKEINRVICGDIYGLLCNLFRSQLLDGAKKRPENFDYYKLSGQSCKVSLFSSLLREYIPGRRLRPSIYKKSMSQDESAENLKLDCLRGSIHYIKDDRRNELKIRFESMNPEIIYSVLVEGNYEKDQFLFDQRNQNQILLKVFYPDTQEIWLKVVNKQNAPERKIAFSLHHDLGRALGGPIAEVDTDDIKAKLKEGGAVSDEMLDAFVAELENQNPYDSNTDTIDIVFAVPARDGYGVYICQIMKKSVDEKDAYYFMQMEYENFEDASKTFFDGKR